MSREERQSAMWDLRKKNRNRIFRMIYDRREVSRQDLSNTLALSLPTINQNLKELCTEGLIEFRGTFGSTGGRRPMVIALAHKSFISVGVEITATMMRFVAVDLLGEQIGAARTNRRFTDSPDYYACFASSLESFLNKNRIDRKRIIGVGISLPGIVSVDSTVLEMAPALGVTEFPLSRFIDAIPYKCLFDNDASAGGFAEQFGKTGHKTMAYLSLEKGVGGAIFINGEPYEGVNRRGAEFGHMCLHTHDGRPCSCGKSGCLESHCSIDRLTTDYDIALETFFEEMENGNETYAARFDEYLTDLAIGIANINMIVDCEIIIGGQISQHLPPYMERLRAKVKEHSLPQFNEKALQLSSLRTLTSCTGAALRWVQKVIDET